MNNLPVSRILAAFFFVIIIMLGIFKGQVGQPDTSIALSPPGFKNIIGTDMLGRDLAERLLLASTLSLIISGVAWSLALIIGIAVGSTAAYLDGTSFSRFIEELIAITFATPFLIVLVGVLGLMGPGITNAYIALLLFAWAAPARHSLSMVRQLKSATFIRATLSFGYKPYHIIRWVIIPKVFPSVATASIAILPEILALDVALSFFGLGAQPPTPTIGGLLIDGLNYGIVAWWMMIFPVIALSILCISLRLLQLNTA